MGTKYVRIALAPTSDSIVICIACGGFRSDFKIENGYDTGLHKKCIAKVAAKFTRKKKAVAA